VFGLLRNTLALMVGVTLTCGVIGLSLAWLLERSNLPGRRLWGVILCLPFAVPAFVSSFTWVSLSAQFEGLGGAILVMSLSKYPLIFLPVAATLRNLDPSLEESARTLGQNRWGVFFRVTLPLLWPSLLAGSLLIALHMLVEFGALSIIGLQTFTTAIYQQFELEFSNANAAMLSAVLLAMCLMLLWLELRVAARVAMCASARARRVRPNKCDWGRGLLSVSCIAWRWRLSAAVFRWACSRTGWRWARRRPSRSQRSQRRCCLRWPCRWAARRCACCWRCRSDCWWCATRANWRSGPSACRICCTPCRAW
jgi:ABC-type Fe3+ transport system permease subunit